MEGIEEIVRRSLPVLELTAEEVRSRLVAALRRQNYEATVSDLVVATGIPKREVEEALRLLSHEFFGSHQVTESGEVLYCFPRGLRKRRPVTRTETKGGGHLKRLAVAAAQGVFKRWLLALLGGYFAIFLTFLFPPVLIVFTVLLSSWGDLRRFDYSGGPYSLRRSAGYRSYPWASSRAQEPGYQHVDFLEGNLPLPTHQAFYEYLFGSDRATRVWNQRQLVKVLSFIRGRKGIVSMEEIMTLTGKPHGEAQMYVNELLVAYEGEPEVTDSGTLVYRFPELMKTLPAKVQADSLTPLYPHGEMPLCAQDDSHRRHTTIVNLINGSNLLFGAYYGIEALSYLTHHQAVGSAAQQTQAGSASLLGGVNSFMITSQVAHTLPTVFVTFGVIPLGIACTFYLLHFIAERRGAHERRMQMEEHLRKQVYFQVLSHPGEVDPAEIRLGNRIRVRGGMESFVARVLDELASTYSAEIEDAGEGHYLYHFPEIERETKDLDALRASIDAAEYSLGPVVFDSRARAE